MISVNIENLSESRCQLSKKIYSKTKELSHKESSFVLANDLAIICQS